MAYDKDQLVLMAHGRNRKLYAYYTTDAPASVDTAGYFNSAADMLDTGDVILVVQVNDVAAIGSVTAAASANRSGVSFPTSPMPPTGAPHRAVGTAPMQSMPPSANSSAGSISSPTASSPPAARPKVR